MTDGPSTHREKRAHESGGRRLLALICWHYQQPARWYPLIVIGLCSLGFTLTPFINSFRTHRENKDYTLWYEVGQLARSDRSLYHAGLNGEVRYMYPPTTAVLLYGPLSVFPQPVFVAALAGLTAVAWGFSVLASLYLATGRWGEHPRWLYLLTLLSTGPYVYDLFLLGQINLVLLALVLACVCLNRQGHPWWGGACLGLAITLKVFPLPMLVYWMLRRRWSVVGGCLVSILITGFLLPGVTRGFERTQGELREWYTLMVGDQSGNAMAARSSIGFTRRNQSLVSVSHRLLRPVDCGDTEGDGFRVNLADVSPGTAQKFGYGVCVLLGLMFLFATRVQFAPTPAAEMSEVAMACIGIVLLSPLSWTYFFCWLLPAWVVILTQWPTLGRLKYAAALAALLLFSALSEQITPSVQAYGVTAWGSVVLYLTLITWRRNRDNPESRVA